MKWKEISLDAIHNGDSETIKFFRDFKLHRKNKGLVSKDGPYSTFRANKETKCAYCGRVPSLKIMDNSPKAFVSECSGGDHSLTNNRLLNPNPNDIRYRTQPNQNDSNIPNIRHTFEYASGDQNITVCPPPNYDGNDRSVSSMDTPLIASLPRCNPNIASSFCPPRTNPPNYSHTNHQVREFSVGHTNQQFVNLSHSSSGYSGGGYGQHQSNRGKKRKRNQMHTRKDFSIISVVPESGKLEGGENIFIYFSIPLENFMETQVYNLPPTTRINFGHRRAKLVHKAALSLQNSLSLSEESREIQLADFFLQVIAPRGSRPGKVDVGFELNPNSFQCEKLEGYEYLGDKEKFYYPVSEQVSAEDEFSESSPYSPIGLPLSPSGIGDDGLDKLPDSSYDLFGRTILHYLAAQNKLLEMKELIRKNKADPSSADIMGYTPLDVARYFKNNEVCKYLSALRDNQTKTEKYDEDTPEVRTVPDCLRILGFTVTKLMQMKEVPRTKFPELLELLEKNMTYLEATFLTMSKLPIKKEEEVSVVKARKIFESTKKITVCTIDTLKAVQKHPSIVKEVKTTRIEIGRIKARIKKIVFLLGLTKEEEHEEKEEDLFGFGMEEVEGEGTEGSNKDLLHEKQTLESKLDHLERVHFSKKRECEKLQLLIFRNSSDCLDFLSKKLSKKRGDRFTQFLRSKNVLVKRTMEDYHDMKLISRNMGEVYLAKLKGEWIGELPKILKVRDWNPQSQHLVKNEIIVMLKLKGHPAIIPINYVFFFTDPVSKNKKMGIEMAYFKTDLFRWLRNKTFENKETIEELRSFRVARTKPLIFRVFKKVLEGISFIHEKGVQHRDLKPDNIMLNNEFEVKIVGFGIASNFRRLTITSNDFAATMRYLSPEVSVTEGLKLLNVSSKRETSKSLELRDVYVFGMMLLESIVPARVKIDEIPYLLKTFPFHGDLLWKQKLGLSSPEEIDILKKLLEPDPKRRICAKEALKSKIFESYEEAGLLDKFERDTRSVIREKHVTLVRKNFDILSEQLRKEVEEEKRKNDGKAKVCSVKVDRRPSGNENERKQIVWDALEQSMKTCHTLKSLMYKIKTNFIGEPTYDEGYVARELYSVIFEQVSKYFCDKVGKYYLPTDRFDYSEIFYNLGKLCLKCLLEKRSVKIPFGPLFFALLLNQDPTTSEEWAKYCKFYDPEFFKNLQKVNENQICDALIELKTTFINEDGVEIRLGRTNTREYIISSIMSQIKGVGGNRLSRNLRYFKKGFYAFLPEELSLEIRSLLNPFELERLFFGDLQLSADVVMENMTFPRNSGTLQHHFKLYLSEGDDSKRWDFIRFCTGSCDVINSKIVRDGKNKKIEVRIVKNKGKFIMAHTCGFVLEVGDVFIGNSKYKEFKKQLDFCMESFNLNHMMDMMD